MVLFNKWYFSISQCIVTTQCPFFFSNVRVCLYKARIIILLIISADRMWTLWLHPLGQTNNSQARCKCTSKGKALYQHARAQGRVHKQSELEHFFTEKNKSWQVCTLTNPVFHTSQCSSCWKPETTNTDWLRFAYHTLIFSHSSSPDKLTLFSSCNSWIFFLHLTLL